MAGTPDRHAAALEALRRSVLDSPGVSATGVRAAAYAAEPLGEPLDGFVAKVRHHSERVTDADFASLRASGLDEDEILEVTLAVALGAATEILLPALALLDDRSPDAT